MPRQLRQKDKPYRQELTAVLRLMRYEPVPLGLCKPGERCRFVRPENPILYYATDFAQGRDRQCWYKPFVYPPCLDEKSMVSWACPFGELVVDDEGMVVTVNCKGFCNNCDLPNECCPVFDPTLLAWDCECRLPQPLPPGGDGKTKSAGASPSPLAAAAESLRRAADDLARAGQSIHAP
jgi:hypothetical protein